MLIRCRALFADILPIRDAILRFYAAIAYFERLIDAVSYAAQAR
jgi:hypothetical protein